MSWFRRIWDKLFGPVERVVAIHDCLPVEFPEDGESTQARTYNLPADPNRAIKSVYLRFNTWHWYPSDLVFYGFYGGRRGSFCFGREEEAGLYGYHGCHAWSGMSSGGTLAVVIVDQYDGDGGIVSDIDGWVVYSKHAPSNVYGDGGESEAEWLYKLKYAGDMAVAAGGKRKRK